MEITIILCILLGVSIIVLGTICSLQIISGSKERRELQKLLKSSNLQEYVQLGDKNEEDKIDEPTNLVEIENMDTIVNDNIDKKFKSDRII